MGLKTIELNSRRGRTKTQKPLVSKSGLRDWKRLSKSLDCKKAWLQFCQHAEKPISLLMTQACNKLIKRNKRIVCFVADMVFGCGRYSYRLSVAHKLAVMVTPRGNVPNLLIMKIKGSGGRHSKIESSQQILGRLQQLLQDDFHPTM